MRKITDIYKEYNIMSNLQLHQLRVAGVASQLCDALNIKVDKNIIITACLLHDMGNIIKSDLNYFPDFLEPEGFEYWQNVKNKFIEKYGNVEHEATAEIMQEIGVNKRSIELANKSRFSSLCIDKDGDDIMLKIQHYSDARVGPYGILSYDERMNDAKKRYQGRNSNYEEEKRQELVNCGKEIEKQIFAYSNIKPEDINDESVANIIEELKNYEI